MSQFPDELAAISTLRTRYPSVPQRKFARQIKANNFNDARDRELTSRLLGRTTASIYGAIRRLDKKLNAGNTTTKTKTPALAGV